MGVPKLPASMREANGRHPGTDSGDRPINFGPTMGEADNLHKPDYLSEDASALWDVLVQELKGSGVLRSVDATALAAGCETYARWREALQLRREHGIVTESRLGATVKAPWVAVEEVAGKQLQSWLREFGLTPSAVSSLIQKQPPVDQLDDPFEWGPTA